MPETHRRELERKRESVEATTNLRDGGRCLHIDRQIGFHGLGALEEQRRGRVCVEVWAAYALAGGLEGRQSDLMFAPNSERSSAGDEEGQARAGHGELGNERCRGQKML